MATLVDSHSVTAKHMHKQEYFWQAMRSKEMGKNYSLMAK